jgi:hypothetical protein
LHACLCFFARLFLSSLLNVGALKAANARVSSLEAELEASMTAFDAATTAKVNAEKSAKSALAKAKKAEKDLANDTSKTYLLSRTLFYCFSSNLCVLNATNTD